MKNNRRQFLKKSGVLAAASIAGLSSCSTNKPEKKQTASYLRDPSFDPKKEPYIKIAFQASPEPSPEQLTFLQQLGVDQVVLWTGADRASYEYYNSRRELYKEHGINVFGFGNNNVHNQDKITLGLEGRDEKIEEYLNHIRNLSKAGIGYTTYAHMANGIWSTGRKMTRNGSSSARTFNLAEATVGNWNGVRYEITPESPFTHGRRYSEEELWVNYEYFIKKAAAEAERLKVKIGIHPDDPPVYDLGGIPRCIFGNFDGYKRALEMANSPYVGMCLCVGCWLEGGTMMGKDVIETIKYFGAQKKIFKVHFRNVDQQMPHFTETFLNEGYADMYQILKALKEVDFDGVIISDHIPRMEYPNTGQAWSIGYMQALVERVIAEG
jgi:mannonate dehydratase